MTRTAVAAPVAARKAAAPRRRKTPATPVAAAPEPAVLIAALAEIEAATTEAADAAQKKKDRSKARKQKLVRDSFTMPEEEYAVLGEMKKACLRDGVEVKKSELLRVAVSLLRSMDVPQLQQALAALAPVRAGRPSKQK